MEITPPPLPEFTLTETERVEPYRSGLKVISGLGGLSVLRTVDALRNYYDGEHQDAAPETLDALGAQGASPVEQLEILAAANERELDRFVEGSAISIVPHENYRDDGESHPVLQMKTSEITAAPADPEAASSQRRTHAGLALRYYRGVYDDFVKKLDEPRTPNRVFHRDLTEPTQFVQGRLTTEPDADAKVWLQDIGPDLTTIALDGEYGPELNPEYTDNILPSLNFIVYGSGDPELVGDYESLVDFVNAETGLESKTVKALKQPMKPPHDYKQDV